MAALDERLAEQTDERLDRQLRISGWNQRALSTASIGIVSDSSILASMYALSCAALGISRVHIIAPELETHLLDAAKKINPDFEIAHIKGFYTHNAMNTLLGTSIIVDMSHYVIANKLLLNYVYSVEPARPLIQCRVTDSSLKIFTYNQGREWQCINEMLSQKALPSEHYADPVLAMIAAGIVLEETKNLLMNNKSSPEIIKYEITSADKEGIVHGINETSVHSINETSVHGIDENIVHDVYDINKDDNKKYDNKKHDNKDDNKKILVVGAGALGNFAGLALAYLGFKDITIIDPDKIESTNLNRQILLYEKIGESKADVLSQRLNNCFGTMAKAIISYFRKDTNISDYDAVLDCVDNFETRIIMSEKCKEKSKILISGGTNIDAGQAVPYIPGISKKSLAESLGLYRIVEAEARERSERIEHYERNRASCTYRPEPSVIMTNQIIAGIMVDVLRRVFANKEAGPVFYMSNNDKRFA